MSLRRKDAKEIGKAVEAMLSLFAALYCKEYTTKGLGPRTWFKIISRIKQIIK